MSTLNFPADHQQVMPYLVIKNAADFIRFMQDVFEANTVMPIKDNPYGRSGGIMDPFGNT